MARMDLSKTEPNDRMKLGIFTAPTPECLANSTVLRSKGWDRLWRYPEVAESLAALAVRESSLSGWKVTLTSRVRMTPQQVTLYFNTIGYLPIPVKPKPFAMITP